MLRARYSTDSAAWLDERRRRTRMLPLHTTIPLTVLFTPIPQNVSEQKERETLPRSRGGLFLEDAGPFINDVKIVAVYF